MSTGKSVNFKNGGERFNITIEDDGVLTFRANEHNGDGDLRMTVRDKTNEVQFNGDITVDETVTVGGTGQDGGLQLRAADGDNTLFLGSSGEDVNAVLGGNGRYGHLQAKNADGNVTVDLRASAGSLTLGAAGQDGDITLVDAAGVRSLTMNGDPAKLEMWFGSQRSIAMDASKATVTVGTDGKAGTIDVVDDFGDVTIKLTGAGGLIEYDQLQQDTSPDGAPTLRNALDRVLALRAVSYQVGETPQVGMRAEDVGQVCPELVATVAEGRTGVNYARMAAVLFEAVKEQQQLIDDLRDRLHRLETKAA